MNEEKEIKLSEVAKKIGKTIKGKFEEKEREAIISELWKLREQTNNRNVKKILLDAMKEIEDVS